MHTVELLEEAVAAAESLGYILRYEWLDGAGGGACEIGGRRIIFVDLALSPDEQFTQVLESLEGNPAASELALSVSLHSTPCVLLMPSASSQGPSLNSV